MMSLRWRVLRSVGLTLVGLVSGIYALACLTMLRSFGHLEREDAAEQMARVVQSFAQMEGEVHSKTSDWAAWDDAYSFMKNGNAAFVKSNLSSTALNGLHVDAVLFADRQGRLFKSKCVEGTSPNLANELLATVERNGFLTRRKALNDGVSGHVLLRSGPMLVSIRPILPTAGHAPIRGWLVFARRFGASELETLKRMTHLDVAVGPDRTKSPEVGGIAPLDQDRIGGHAVLADLSGDPNLRLSMTKPRSIYHQGVASLHQMGGMIVFAGLVFAGMIMLVLERSALSRLARLGAEVETIGEASEESGVTVEGEDELGRLAESINAMLAKLHEGELRLQGYNSDLEATVRERTREIEHQAFHDKLTGLPNRALFMNRIEVALEKARRTGLGVAAFFIDLDNFKLVNDSLGHSTGDALLVGVAQRLRDSIRPGDTVARLGGDEFTVLLEDLEEPEEAEMVARRILESLNEPFHADGNELYANGSIGIAYIENALIDADGLMKNADAAMYVAKTNGKAGYEFFNESMNQEALERLALENGLHRALEQGEIEVYYQPLIHLETGALIGAEALARWTHPTFGRVSPTQFVPIAEETGMIVPIGYWVLEEACRQAVAWHTETFTLSVNLSGKQLQRSDVVERVEEILQKTGLSPQRLKLEITESVLMSNRGDVVEKMHRLKALGIRLALDDFGTGYSSLATLGAFPIDTLKIDRAFISRLGEEVEATSIVQAIMALSRSMGMDVTGEGVETHAQLRLMQDLSCDIGQGYLFDRPLSAKTFTRRLEEEEELRWAA